MLVEQVINLTDFQNVNTFHSVKNSQEIEDVFHKVFFHRYNTVLCGGYDEPLYMPSSDEKMPNKIMYRHDYISSALHEVAHWCVAGEERRKREDYGYWYSPDGRDEQQQKKFEQVEVLPQAIECAFSKACGLAFRVSIDNLNGNVESSVEQNFANKVQSKLYSLEQGGFNQRTTLFIDALKARYCKV